MVKYLTLICSFLREIQGPLLLERNFYYLNSETQKCMLGPTCFFQKGGNFPGEVSTFCTGGVAFYETTHHFKPFRFRSHVNRQNFLHLLGPHRHKLSPKAFLFVGVGTHVFILKINPKRNSTVGNYSVWVGKEFVQQIFGHRSNEV